RWSAGGAAGMPGAGVERGHGPVAGVARGWPGCRPDLPGHPGAGKVARQPLAAGREQRLVRRPRGEEPRRLLEAGDGRTVAASRGEKSLRDRVEVDEAHLMGVAREIAAFTPGGPRCRALIGSTRWTSPL